MLKDDYLIQKLKDEVLRIKTETYEKFGFQPLVCTDEDIAAIAVKRPHSLEEIYSVNKLDGNLREEYAKRLVDVIKEFEAPADKRFDFVENKSSTAQILIDLSKKLTDLSKTNPMLAMMKLSSSHVDISKAGLDANFFSGSAGAVICDKKTNSDDAQLYDDLAEVIRNVKSGQRDIGQNELYVAYPYVEGRIPNTDFGIRAPLILFPVSLEKGQSKIKMIPDHSRDPIFNSNLALASLRFSDTELNIGDNRLIEYNGSEIISKLNDYYKKFDIDLEFGDLVPISFEECAAGTFDMFEEGKYIVKPYMVIGKFTNDSNTIQSDYKGIVKDDKLPMIIGELVGNVGKIDDIYADNDLEAECADIPEGELYYINQLNSAQENILKAMNDESAFVIQGPPGTGKSQVITGLIASAIAQRKKILVVSEKKTALDVIRSRLGKIGDYVMMIDDPSDKDSFYKQIASMLKRTKVQSAVDTGQIAAEIDKDVQKLSVIRDAVFTPMEGFLIEPFRLYEMGKMFDFTDKKQYEEFAYLQKCVPKDLMTLSFDDLSTIHRSLDDIDYLAGMFRFFEFEKQYPWVKSLKSNLSEIQLASFADKMQNVRELHDRADKASVLTRVSSRAKFNSANDEFARTYLAEGASFEAFVNCADLNDIVQIYSIYSDRKNSIESTSKEYQLYLKSIFSISKGDLSVAKKANEDTYRFIITSHLSEFDAKHPEVRSTIHDFESILRDIELRVGDKMRATAINVMCSLMKSISGLASMEGDIRRVLESKNRWSISKFLIRFSIIDKIDVWLMTPQAVSDVLPLKKGLFDLVVFDEASQMYAERAIPAIYRGNQVIIAGDNKQLRPSALGSARITYEEDSDDLEDNVDAALEQESLLDLARLRYRTYTLNFHYRSVYEELIAFSNNAFYNGELYVSPNMNTPALPPIEYHKVDGIWEKTRNMEEAKKVISMIREILRTRTSNESIGVITFNSSQRDLIFDLIEKESQNDAEFSKMITAEMDRKGDGGEDIGLFVKNIETVQGDERDIIIFSIGYAKGPDGTMMQRFGWLNQRGGENRLNVAISRAKRKIHIVTSLEPEELKVDGTKNDGPKILKEYMRYCKAVSNRDEEAVKQILERQLRMPGLNTKEDEESLKMIRELRDYLESNGYGVKENVGVSGYNLALAVYGKKGVILGIEADRSIYPRIASTRERDVHRINYLRGRGWKICRVWVSEYWKNCDEEFKRVLNAVKKAEVN